MGAGFSFAPFFVAPPPPPTSPELTTELQAARTRPQGWNQSYQGISSRSVDFAEVNRELDETNKALKPRRPRTAPAEDLSLERRMILNGPTINVLMIQIALFFAVLSLLSFLVLSRDVAQGVTFLLLSTGVALGFFLRK